jgi:hypothetical protein
MFRDVATFCHENQNKLESGTYSLRPHHVTNLVVAVPAIKDLGGSLLFLSTLVPNAIESGYN